MRPSRSRVGAAYGLAIRSQVDLPELAPARGRPQVVLRLARFRLPSPYAAWRGSWTRWTAPQDAYLRRAGVGVFRVRGGREILACPRPGVPPGLLRRVLLGPVMVQLLLQRRHRFPLHASAVAVRGRAVLFLGRSGAGKSTLAAAFHARGHRVLGDDVAVVRTGPGRPAVLPAFPRLRLPPASVRILGLGAGVLAAQPGDAKRGYAVGRGFPSRPLPLGRVYVLERGPRIRVLPLDAVQALWALQGHAFYGGAPGAVAQAASGFGHCLKVLARVPVCRLQRPRSGRMLSRLVRRVERDLAG